MKTIAYIMLLSVGMAMAEEQMVVVPRSWLEQVERRLRYVEMQAQRAVENGGSAGVVSIGKEPPESGVTPVQRLPDGEHAKAGFPAMSTSLWYKVTNNYDAIELYEFSSGNFYDISGKDVGASAFDILARTNSAAPHLVYLRGALKDEKAAVEADTEPRYVGETHTNGFLWCNITGLTYTVVDGGDAVEIGHRDLTSQGDSDNAGTVVIQSIDLDTAGLGHVTYIATVDLAGLFVTKHSTTNPISIGAGTNNYDLTRWSTTDKAWVVLPNDADVLKYQVLQKKGSGAGGEVGFDWVRTH